MEGGQRIRLGQHAQSLNIVCKESRKGREAVQILLQQMAVMSVLVWRKKKRFVPHKRMDVQVRIFYIVNY